MNLSCCFFITSMCQLLNHPHLSAHIDETDEDALSYMTDLEVGHFILTISADAYLSNGRKHVFLPFSSD